MVGGSVAKIRAGLEDLQIVTEEQAEALRKIEGAADLFTGTAQLATGAMHLWKKATDAQKTAMIGLGLATASVGLAMMAMNAQTNEEAALFSTLTGITSGLAIAQFTLALAKYSAAVAGAGPAAPIMAAVIGGALVAASVYWVSTKDMASAQTGEGQVLNAEVLQTGLVEIHQGEQMSITRGGGVMANLRRTGGGGFRDLNITLVGAFDPMDPRGQRRIATQLGRLVIGDNPQYGGQA